MAGKMSAESLQAFEHKIGYRFSDKDLLVHALSHTSYTNEHELPKTQSNERLEFLGDAVVDMIVSDYLYKNYRDLPEGMLTKLRAAVVCESSFAELAAAMGFGDYILLGRGEEATGGRSRASVLADSFEAVTAAIYLDGGIGQAAGWITERLKAPIRLAASGKAAKDYKTTLQEMVQKGSSGRVSYQVTNEQGPDHAKVFTVEVSIDDVKMAQGRGTSKKDAEQAAASAAIKQIVKKNTNK